MKQRKGPSVLNRVLLNCSFQAKEYGRCIAGKVPEIEQGMCSKEFQALKACMQKTIKNKA